MKKELTTKQSLIVSLERRMKVALKNKLKVKWQNEINFKKAQNRVDIIQIQLSSLRK